MIFTLTIDNGQLAITNCSDIDILIVEIGIDNGIDIGIDYSNTDTSPVNSVHACFCFFIKKIYIFIYMKIQIFI